MSKNDRVCYNYIRYENDKDTVVVEKYINGKFECEYCVKNDECTCPGFKHRGACKHLKIFEKSKVGEPAKVFEKSEARPLVADAYLKLRSLYKYVEFMGYAYSYKNSTDKVDGLYFECDKPAKEFPKILNFSCNDITVLINSKSFFNDDSTE